MSKTKAQLSFKVERQAKEIFKLHKKIKEDKKKALKLLIEKNRIIAGIEVEKIRLKKDLRDALLKLVEQNGTIRSLQSSVLRVTDQREDEAAKLVISEAAYKSEIKKLEAYIESLTPDKQNMSNAVLLSRVIKRA